MRKYTDILIVCDTLFLQLISHRANIEFTHFYVVSEGDTVSVLDDWFTEVEVETEPGPSSSQCITVLNVCIRLKERLAWSGMLVHVMVAQTLIKTNAYVRNGSTNIGLVFEVPCHVWLSVKHNKYLLETVFLYNVQATKCTVTICKNSNEAYSPVATNRSQFVIVVQQIFN
jgi:hypothetical protein